MTSTSINCTHLSDKQTSYKMIRLCLKPNSSFRNIFVSYIIVQTLIILSIIFVRKDFRNEDNNHAFIEYQLREGTELVYSHRYKKDPDDLQFPILKDVININVNNIGINPSKMGVKYPASENDLRQILTYHFQPIITAEEKTLVLFTLQMFINICQRHKLTYFITYGSLLGSYRHHGIVPWDDDIDVFMNETDKRKVVLTLGNVPGFELSHLNNYQWKFFPKFYKTLLGFKHRWPFVDMFFFGENHTHIWDNTSTGFVDRRVKLYRKSEIFPLVSRPFEGLLLLAPCNVVTIMDVMFTEYDWCESNRYWHKLEKTPMRPKKIQCTYLYFLYPFVFRSPKENSSVILEQLQINGRTMETYEFKTQCGK